MADHSPEPVVCAVDVGTSAVRAALVTSSGATLATSRRKRADPGIPFTFDLDRLWDDTAAVLRDVTGEHSGPVAALGMAGHVGSVLADADGHPVVPAGGWADTRGVRELERRWGARRARALRAIGRPEVSGGALAVLCELPCSRSGVVRPIRHLFSPKDALLLRLTGEAVTDETSAAYTLGFDVGRREWARDLVDAVGLPDGVLPAARTAPEVVGTVTATAEHHTGLLRGTPVVAGGPDGTVGAVAAVGTQSGALVDVAGTTDVINRIVSADYGEGSDVAGPVSIVRNPYVAEGLWLHGGPTGLTGGAFAHVAELLGVGAAEDVGQRAGEHMVALPPGCEGVTVLPALTGSRFPFWDRAERGAVVGLGTEHTAAHILKATQEAAAFVARAAIDLLDPADHAPRAVALAGGAARSDTAAQLRADILGRTVTTCDDPDVSLRGAAVLAAVGAGLYPDVEAARTAVAGPTRILHPDPVRATQYTDVYQRWCAVRAALSASTSSPVPPDVPDQPFSPERNAQ